MFRQKTLDVFQQYLDNSNYTDAQKEILQAHRTNILNQALFNLGLDTKIKLNDIDRQALGGELLTIVNYVGNEVPLFDTPHYRRALQSDTDDGKLNIDIKNLLKFLLIGTPFNYNYLKKDETVESLFKKRSPRFMQAFREGFQDIFKSIDLQALQQLDPAGERRFEIQLANMLAMYALCDPYQEVDIKLPRKVNNQWQLVDFNIHTIELKPDEELYPELYKLYADEKGGVIDPNYRVFAYVMSPKDSTLNLNPYLVFGGTPPETGQGHLFAALTDFMPNHSVGESMFRSNIEMLRSILKSLLNKAIVTGQSLGANMSLLTSGEFPQYIERVEAFNPAGFNKATLAGELFDNYNKTPQQNKPPVMPHLQQYDPVKFAGYWHDDWKLNKIFPKRHESFLSSYWAHIKSFANEAGAVSLNLNVDRENNRLQRRIISGIKNWADSGAHSMFKKNITKQNKKIMKERETEEKDEEKKSPKPND